MASTILNPSSGLGSIVGDETIRPIKQVIFLRLPPRRSIPGVGLFLSERFNFVIRLRLQPSAIWTRGIEGGIWTAAWAAEAIRWQSRIV